MNTLDFLDKINGAIAQSFAPLIGQPNQKLGAVHNAVGELVAPIVKEYGLLYSTWVLRPQDVSGLFLYEVELFRLNTDGFIKYKYSVRGRWERAPRYEVLAAVSAPTVEEVIKRGVRQHIEKQIHDRRQHVTEQIRGVEETENRIEELLMHLENYV